MDKLTKNITIRIPEELFGRLAELAEKEHRSISSQVVYILDRALRDKETAGSDPA